MELLRKFLKLPNNLPHSRGCRLEHRMASLADWWRSGDTWNISYGTIDPWRCNRCSHPQSETTKLKTDLNQQTKQYLFSAFNANTINVLLILFWGAHTLHQQIRQTIHLLLLVVPDPADRLTRPSHGATGTTHVRCVQWIVGSGGHLTGRTWINGFVDWLVRGRRLKKKPKLVHTCTVRV